MRFLRLSVTNIAGWLRWCGSRGMTAIAELDGKEHFNNITPQKAVHHLSFCADWLAKRYCWRASELVWGVHHTEWCLDRAEKASSAGFPFVSHAKLITIVGQELTCNDGCFSAGHVWTRTNCIPMGGSFSAQGTDLCSVWGCIFGQEMVPVSRQT